MNDLKAILEKARFGADGLIPAIVQDQRTREVHQGLKTRRR